MSYWQTYKSRTNFTGTSNRERIINEQKRFVDNSFAEMPDYYEVSINGTKEGVRIVDDSDTKEQKVLLMKPNRIVNVGAIVLWNAEQWLTMHADNVGDIYYRGIIQRCHSSIKWLDSKGKTKEAFFVSMPAGSKLGVDNGTIISLPNAQRIILIPKTLDSLRIKRDQRFIFVERAWKVTDYNRLDKNLISLTLEETVLDPAKDNLELRIADYVGNTHTYTLSISNGDTANMSKDSTLSLTVEVTDNGALVANPSVSFTLSDPNIATVDSAGVVSAIRDGTVTITATLSDDTSISDSIVITVETVVQDNYTVNITSTSTTPYEIKNGQSKTYNSEVYKNSVLITDGSQPVTWALFADDQVTTTTLATITAQTGTSCTVKNNAASSGYVQLRAMLVSDNSIIKWIRIQMKPLF